MNIRKKNLVHRRDFSYGDLKKENVCHTQVCFYVYTREKFQIVELVNGILLQALLKFDGTLTCGGTVVRNDNNTMLIITAASCVDGYIYTSKNTICLNSY